MKCSVFFLSLLTALGGFASSIIKNFSVEPMTPFSRDISVRINVSEDLPFDAGEYQIYLSASNVVTKEVFNAMDLFGNRNLVSGMHTILWKVEDNSFFNNGTYVFHVRLEKTYLVIDLSKGATAESYAISYLNDVPKGGWSDEYKTNKLVLRRIEPGVFRMGGQYKTIHTMPYYIGVFEITQKQFELVVGSNPSKYKGDIRPVETVSWNMIRSSPIDNESFIGKLRSKTGLSFDLPTEAQWEFACSAGTTNLFNNGTESMSGLGCNRISRSDGKGGFYQHTVVGMYNANNWGLYDMHGNVMEWCYDWYGSLSFGLENPAGKREGQYKVVRGGSWGDYPGECSSFYRHKEEPTAIYSLDGKCGFRICLTVRQ